jgi:hypothetical protein
MSAKGHFSSSTSESSLEECELCDDAFDTDEECNDYMIYDHLYCRDCDRTFMNQNNIKQVMRYRDTLLPLPILADPSRSST